MLPSTENILMKIDEIVLVEYKEQNEIVICRHCSGIGSYTTEELVDYHRNDYETVRHHCKFCKGDGRLVKITTSKRSRDDVNSKEIPLLDFEQDPFDSKYVNVRYRVDRRDLALERKYPELAKFTYDEYDKLAEKYRILDALSKEKHHG